MITKLTYFVIVACLVTTEAPAVTLSQKAANARVRQADNRAKLARVLLENLLQSQDIPREALERARAIAVFPTVTKTRISLTRSQTRGQGLISRRTEIGWTAPAFFEIAKSGSGVKEVSKLVIVFNGDGEVEDLRGNKLTFDEVESTSPRPVLKRKGDLTPVSNIRSYAFVNGVSIDPIIEGATLRPNNDDNRAVYNGLNAEDVLFRNKRRALDTLEADEVLAFTKRLNNVSPNIITPNINEFPDAAFDYNVYQSLEGVKTHMKEFLRSQDIGYREEPSDLGVVITAYVELPRVEGRRRIMRAAFLIKVIPQGSYCSVKFKWLVQSKGDREREWTHQPEDTKDYAKVRMDPISMELKKLEDSSKPKS
jgi:lipid-binding SYLF domain-containing protein